MEQYSQNILEPVLASVKKKNQKFLYKFMLLIIQVTKTFYRQTEWVGEGSTRDPKWLGGC